MYLNFTIKPNHVMIFNMVLQLSQTRKTIEFQPGQPIPTYRKTLEFQPGQPIPVYTWNLFAPEQTTQFPKSPIYEDLASLFGPHLDCRKQYRLNHPSWWSMVQICKRHLPVRYFLTLKIFLDGCEFLECPLQSNPEGRDARFIWSNISVDV